MIVNSIKPYTNENTSFGHNSGHKCGHKNPYSVKDRAIVAGTTAAGVLASLAFLAKGAKYSLNPAKMFKNLKNSYLAKEEFLVKQVLAMGVGTCLGGLAGGYIIDKNKENRKAKQREAIMQMGNISIPILTVSAADKIFNKSSKSVKAVASLSGVFLGVLVANLLMNKLGNAIFKNKSERGIKVTDFSAHLDDVVVSASYISKDKLVHAISRIVPLALMIPGNEVGNKTAH